MPTWEFTLKITGYGDDKKEAWQNAFELLCEGTPSVDSSKIVKAKEIDKD